MSTISNRAPLPAGSGLNDDIGEDKRLALYRSQVRLRDAEQRAFDLFLQNLVKGTSHLSLGQEAIAAGFAEAMVKGDYTPSFKLWLATKDARLAADAGAAVGAEIPVIEAIAAQMEAVAAEHPDEDVAALFRGAADR